MTTFNCFSKYLENQPPHNFSFWIFFLSSYSITPPHSFGKVWEWPFPSIQRFHSYRSAGLLCWNSSASTKDVRWHVNPCEMMFQGGWTSLRHKPLQSVFQAGSELDSVQNVRSSGQLKQQNVGLHLKLNSRSTAFSQEIEWHMTSSDASIFCLHKYDLYLSIRAVKLQ